MKTNLKKIQDYLSGKLGADESLDVQLYLAGHMEDPEVADMLDHHFDSSRVEADSRTLGALWNTRKRLGLSQPRRNNKFIRYAIAAAIALLLAVPASLQLGWHLKPDPVAVSWQEYYVPFAQTYSLQLPDGTKLTLNAGSRVTYPDHFTGDTREIFLDGEVLAEVAKDEEHPFIIHTGDANVRVYGTVFDLKAYRDASVLEVMLREGSVGLDIPSEDGRQEIRLTPGDLTQYDRMTGELTLGKMSGYRSFADGGSLSFINVPLRDIVSDLERSFGKRIVVADESLANERFLAFFTNGESLDEILALLEQNGNLCATLSGDTYYINKYYTPRPRSKYQRTNNTTNDSQL